MEKNKERKVYPSELNSKSIACRIPMYDYVNIMNECVNKGITVNDWLLLKIYGKQSNEINGLSNQTIISADRLKYTNEQIEYWKENSERYEYQKENDLLMEFPFAILINGKGVIEFEKSHEFIEWVMNNNNNNKRIASIEDVKSQLTVLIDNKFDNIKDRREFRKDILPLLRELE